jgi:hypothetical protein
MNQTLFVNETSASQISSIRMQEYAKASGFAVDLKTLQWQQSDNDSFIMATKSDDTLSSTMRGEVILEQSLLEKKLECPWDFPLLIEYPVLLLSRAATLSSHRSLGLNLLLRYWFLRFAQHHQIPFIIGTFVSGSPRENTLRDLGYQFFFNDLGWQQSTYRSLRPVQVVALDMRLHGAKAIEYCEERIPDLIAEYNFADEFPRLKIQGA